VKGFLDLFLGTGHFSPGTAINDLHVLESQADAVPGAVQGHVAAADDRHLVNRNHLLPQAQAPEKLRSLHHVLGDDLFSLAADLGTHMGADGGEYRRIALFLEIGHIQGLHLAVEADVNAHALDQVDLVIENVLGEAVIRNADRRHAARLG